jgi:Leucine-rich repeat (LRR) protein
MMQFSLAAFASGIPQNSTKPSSKIQNAVETDIPQTEKDVLQAFYNISLDKNSLTGWNFSTPVTSWDSHQGTGWYGVTVTNGHITGLDLVFSNQLNGTIPQNISQLTQLQNLTISSSDIHGAIPPEICDLINLKTLYFNGTKLSGSIPNNIGQLVNLENLTIANTTGLSGSMPNSIGQLSKLKNLSLKNDSTGEISQEIFKLRNLESINLTGFSGYLSSSISQ